MTIKYTCPLCKHTFYNSLSLGYVATTPWTDKCCCCDQTNCVAHQIYPPNMPSRPSEEIMLERAEQIANRQKTNFNQKINYIEKEYQEITRLAELAEEIQKYLGHSFETIEEFKEVVDCLRSNFFEEIDDVIQDLKGKQNENSKTIKRNV